MEPKYMSENRYSYLTSAWRQPVNIDYEVNTPETVFERKVHSLFFEGQKHLHHEEFALALHAFRELQSLILRTAHPKMPIDPNQSFWIDLPTDVTLVNTFVAKAAEILKETPIVDYKFPASMISEKTILPLSVQQKLEPIVNNGIQITSYHGFVFDEVEKAMAAAEKDNWSLALKHYTDALRKVPGQDRVVRASLLHDMAILNEKVNRGTVAIQQGVESVKLFSEAKLPEPQVHALETMTGIYNRAGKKTLAADSAKKADALRKKYKLHPVIFSHPFMSVRRPLVTTTAISSTPSLTRPLTPTIAPFSTEVGTLASAISATSGGPKLMTMEYLKVSPAKKTLTVHGTTTSASIVLDRRAITNVRKFQQTLANTRDIELLTGYWRTPQQLMAYLPHMYFFVIPMTIGDCLTGLGNLKEAENKYLSVLPYPYINRRYEIVRLWTRLAEVYLEMGDEAYRRAKDNTTAYSEAKKAYENIVRTNGTLNANSPLYKDSKFATIKTRVSNFLAASDPSTFRDNPRILTKVLRARVKLNQIKVGLNYLGYGLDYLPPFSFEYLQNTAKYFAKQASQIEQRYIQYKSTAENEEFRREQLDQQAEVARQTVVLEQRGLAEANAGIAVAQASVNYAETQRANAVKAKNDFNNARWELLEYAELEAWANASSVDRDEQVKLTILGYQYYNSSGKRRNNVLQDLAYQRTRLSHNLEANKLQRAIDSATAYKGVAQAQLAQAQARKAIAEQRVQIAQLQQRYAEENRDFLDMKEFSARLWYELAREARRLTRRYLDMTIEVALLMERAYNVETERGLNVIRFDYSNMRTGDLMGADWLLRDIDYFTLDYITTIKSKKTPIKKTISLADSFPISFQQLKTEGRCFFQTELADFDREHPGLYLCKMRNVELVFVGITKATSLAGSLRNVGISRFRRGNGSIITRLYPSDVMPLSQYDIRQDTLAFRFNPNDLRLFENNGIDTLWQLELPMHANDFDFKEILDIHLVLYYDGFFSSGLESNVIASLPGSGSASRAFSMRMMFPDELFYLRSKGDAELIFDLDMFPYNQTNPKRTDAVMKVLGDSAAVAGLTLRLLSAGHGSELKLKTDANGEVNDSTPGKPLRKLRNKSMIDQWTLKITAADNPALVSGGKLDLSGISDIMVFFEYNFDYR